MNNYERILALIKDECEKQKRMAEISCFDKIARIANVPASKLPLYLNHLQGTGFIKYSMSERYIYLTEKGRKHIPEKTNV